MKAFEFHSVPRIVFGRGTLARAGELAVGFGDSALVVASAGASAGGAIDRLAESLRAVGMRFAVEHHKGEPTVADVDRLAEAARAQSAAVLIALGGGSVVDAAKAASGLLTNGGSALDYLEVVGTGKKITRAGAPWIAIPTTAGTGAEATRNAVVAVPAKQFKASIRSEHILARAAIVDPDLSASCPPAVTAAAGMDALCQLLESYTSTGAQPMTDALAREGLVLAGRFLLRAFRDGGDLEAREGMALAALLSGIALANAGLGAVHGIAAPLGACVPVPHGSACAALLPHVVEANLRALRAENPGHNALRRYAELGRTLSGRQDLPDAEAADACVACLGHLVAELAIPRLSAFGLTHERIPQVAQLAGRSNSMRYNPARLSESDLIGVLSKAL